MNSRPFPGGRGACRCPESRRRWPAEAWMPQRRHLRANAAQDGRSERPATGRGQPRPSQDVARTSGNPCAERDCHGGLCPRTVSGLRPCFRRPFSAVRATRNRPSRRFPIAQTSIGVPRTRRPTAVGCPPASSTSSAFAARPNRGPARALPGGRRARGRRDGRRLERFAEVCQGLTSRGRSHPGLLPLANLRFDVSRRLPAVSSQSDVATAPRALQRKLLAHLSHEFGPSDPGGVVRSRFVA